VAGTNGCTGSNISPEIDWANAPDGTQSFAVSMYDMDAPTGSGLWHWYVFNIPASASSLPAGAGDSSKNLLPTGAVMGRNDAGENAYRGPCPPVGDLPHRYLITVFALKAALPLDQKASGALVGFYVNGMAFAKTTIVALYGR
jgi:Raf kinase inhibitor-like YbhB/YbcL family protein